MAKSGIVYNGSITAAGADLSLDCKSYSLNMGQPGVAFSGYGDTTAIETPGLLTWSLSARFFHDFAAGKVDATLGPAWQNKSVLSLIVQEVSGARSATNPGYSGLAFISQYNTPIGGEHGAIGICDVTFSPYSALTRMTS